MIALTCALITLALIALPLFLIIHQLVEAAPRIAAVMAGEARR